MDDRLEASAQTIPERPGRSIPDRVLGGIGSAMILAAVWILVFGGPGDAAVVGDAVPPPLQIISATTDGGPGGAVPVHFSSGAPLARVASGWGANGFHLHAEVNGREIMPGPDDIRRSADGTYRWDLMGLTAGEHEIRIVWSNAQHVAVDGGGSASVKVEPPEPTDPEQ